MVYATPLVCVADLFFLFCFWTACTAGGLPDPAVLFLFPRTAGLPPDDLPAGALSCFCFLPGDGSDHAQALTWVLPAGHRWAWPEKRDLANIFMRLQDELHKLTFELINPG